ncbi:MAG: hypothetical protein IIA67_05150 [Planctomycetes bacterium]|nr:hypothetical protein [Planctomycetota bacterium]
MNFFAHGRLFLDEPYFLAGTAVPDWLNVVNRRVRARRKASLALSEDSDPAVVAVVVNRISTRPTDQLAVWIGRFSAEWFLYDYAEDAKLLVRLNQVMRRVKLPLLPESFVEMLPDTRRAVDERVDELLEFEPV